MMTHAGLLSLAVRFPSRIMTNAHWLEHHPQMVAQLEELALNRTWSVDSQDDAARGPFDRAMMPYLSDPFRGCQSRRWLGENEDATELEVQTARAALAAAQLTTDDIDLCIVASFPPPQINVGNAAYVAQRLGLTCAAWNLEATCSSPLLALETAIGLVQGGQATRVLIVVSCWYSLAAPAEEVISLANGDGVSAMVVGPTPEPFLLGKHRVNTGPTCDALRFELALDSLGKPCVRMRLQRQSGKLIRETTELNFPRCTKLALAKAGLAVTDIDFFAFNAATAWMVPFCVESLGIDPARTIDTHAQFANIGPVLVPSSLFYGAHAGKIAEGARVLMFGIGNTSNASAMVVRWPNVGLAPVQVPLT